MTPWARVRAELGAPHCELDYSDVERWRGDIVYVWTRGTEVLYVGMSLRGLVRPLSATHEKLRAFAPGDTLTVWRAADPVSLEAMLIKRLRPTHNSLCPGCGYRRFSRSWRLSYCRCAAPVDPHLLEAALNKLREDP